MFVGLIQISESKELTPKITQVYYREMCASSSFSESLKRQNEEKATGKLLSFVLSSSWFIRPRSGAII